MAITFAAFNPGACRNLDADNLCRIYERRPLVCRIYPMEINPHIPLRPDAKDCPTEAWQRGPVLIHGSQLMDRQLAELIERSRQADRDDIHAKVQICQQLGITTSALKGNGFTAYLPDTGALHAALHALATPRWRPDPARGKPGAGRATASGRRPGVQHIGWPLQLHRFLSGA